MMTVGVNEDQTEVTVVWTRESSTTHYKALLPKGKDYEYYFVSLDGERWKPIPIGKLDMEPRDLLFEKIREIRRCKGPNNINASVLKVRYADLKPIRPDAMKRKCPVCAEGVLVGQRDWNTFKILPNDRCLLCGQRVEYLDVEELNNA